MPARYPERIVCLTEETTETLYLLGEERRIVGISGYTVRPPRARREKPRFRRSSRAKNDKILALEPDLVIGFSDLQADIARELVRRGAERPHLQPALGRRDPPMILTLAALVGAAAKGERLVAELEAGLARNPRGGRALQTPAARLLRGVGRADDQRHRLGERAGRHRRRRRCLSGPRAQPRRRRAHVADPQEVVRARPDVILGSWCGKKFRPERVAARPGWSEVPAVRDGELHEIKSADSCSRVRRRSPTACAACTRSSRPGTRARRVSAANSCSTRMVNPQRPALHDWQPRGVVVGLVHGAGGRPERPGR